MAALHCNRGSSGHIQSEVGTPQDFGKEEGLLEILFALERLCKWMYLLVAPFRTLAPLWRGGVHGGVGTSCALWGTRMAMALGSSTILAFVKKLVAVMGDCLAFVMRTFIFLYQGTLVIMSTKAAFQAL